MARSLAKTYSCTVRVAPELWRNLSGLAKKSFMALPMPPTYSSTADSPTMRPTARMQPVTIPSMELGSTTVRIMCHLPLPRPRAPSR